MGSDGRCTTAALAIEVEVGAAARVAIWSEARDPRTGRRALSAKLGGSGADGRGGSGSASQQVQPRAHVRLTTLLNRGAAAKMRADDRRRRKERLDERRGAWGGKVAKEKRAEAKG